MKITRTLLLSLFLVPALLHAAVTLDANDPAAKKAVTAAADSPAKEAIDAFNKGRPFEAVRLAKPLAESGNGEALLILGVAHESGQGADPNAELAVDFYRRARKAGNQEAAYRLARILIEQGKEETRKEAKTLLEELSKSDTGTASRILGEGSLRGWFGGEADFEKTASWWARSAEAGDVAAMLALGRLYDGNFGFPDKRNPKAALDQFVRAATLGNQAAMVAAGSRLLNGDEKIRDEKRGREWLDKAIKEGQFDAYLALGDFEEVLKKDDKKALEQYTKGAEGGQTGCMLKLAQFSLEGRAGLEKSEDEALKWFKKAGEGKNPLGHVQAAAMLLKKEGVTEAKMLEGYAHLTAAAESGLVDVQNEVGLLYLSAKLGVRDATAAAAWFGRAASGGFAAAANNLGALYEQGVGVPQNYVQAGRLYTQAANAGHPQATTALGRLHAQGAGIKQDLPKAWALFSLAVERGDNDAKAPLGELTSQLSEEQVTEARKILADFKKPADPKAAGATDKPTTATPAEEPKVVKPATTTPGTTKPKGR